MPEIETPAGAAQRAVPAAWQGSASSLAGRALQGQPLQGQPFPLVSESWLSCDSPELSPSLMDAGLSSCEPSQAGRVLHEERFSQGILDPCPVLPRLCWHCHLPQDTTWCWGL